MLSLFSTESVEAVAWGKSLFLTFKEVTKVLEEMEAKTRLRSQDETLPE